MNNMFSVYVPSTYSIDEPIDNTRYVRRVAKLLALRFGGASFEQMGGAWYSNEKNSLLLENITRVWTYSETNEPQDRDYVLSIAEALKAWLDQESVAFEVIEYPIKSGLQFS